MSEYLWNTQDWSFDIINRTYDEIEKIGVGEYGLNIYQNQFEIISSEQMLDAYTSIGMPVMYSHWSFGKHFSREWEKYKKGYSGLAYELVINSNPCINYLMEENTMTTQALVIAHAGMGHNHFFKNNYLFKTWTDADSIVDYLVFAKNYISKIEISEGQKEVETFLDSCHALMNYGVNQYKHPRKLSLENEKKKQREREEYMQSRVDETYRIIPKTKLKKLDAEKIPKEPEENILYFCEKYSPNLKPWQRECIRIVRKIAQYFYPQGQTKVLNEGTATYFHYNIFKRMYEKGLVTDGNMFEFMALHSNVIYQPSWDSKYYSGMNPYKLGFEVLTDIERICLNPTEQDRRIFSHIIGENPLDVIKDAISNYRDESFILQYLSPKIIKDFKLMSLYDDREADHYFVEAIQDDEGYEMVKKNLAKSYERESYIPRIEIILADLKTRTLYMQYHNVNNRPLSVAERDKTLKHVAVLWGGNDVMFTEIKDGQVYNGVIQNGKS